MEGLRSRHRRFGAHVEQGGGVIEAGVAAQAGRDRKRLVRIVAGPEHNGVERLLMQVVERREGGEGPHDLRAVLGQSVGQGQELWSRLADRQHPKSRGVAGGRIEHVAALGEGLDPDFELFLGDGRADQGLQSHRGLRRMQRAGQRQVEAAVAQPGGRQTHRQDRETPWRAGCAQSFGDPFRSPLDASDIDDGRLDLKVG